MSGILSPVVQDRWSENPFGVVQTKLLDNDLMPPFGW
jgi:hypothetical protein